MLQNNDAEAPEGVDLVDYNDYGKIRTNILKRVRKSMTKSFPQSYGGVRVELDNVRYDNEEPISLMDQKDALLKDKYLTKKLRGTVRLVDEATEEPIEEKDLSLMRVPWLTDRGSFIHGGNEYTCFNGTTKIWTENGFISISRIVKEKMRIRVWSWDFKKNTLVLSAITNWNCRKTDGSVGMASFNSQGYLPTVMGGQASFSTLWSTPDHKVYTPRGDKNNIEAVRRLTILRDAMSDTQIQLIVGTMLGDGHITPEGKYRVRHCQKHKEYVELKKEILGDLVCNDITTGKTSRRKDAEREYLNVGFDSYTSVALKDLRYNIYSGGMRNLKSNWFEVGDERALAFWYADDGSIQYQRDTNCPSITLHTNNFLPVDVEKLLAWLTTKWGVHGCISQSHKNNPIADKSINRVINITGGSAWLFLELVAPYLPECMRYKTLEAPCTKRCTRCNSNIPMTRSVCNSCLLEEVRLTPGKLTKTIRYRFGNSKAARNMTTDEVCLDETPLLNRWRGIQDVLGKGVPDMVKDNKTCRHLCEVDSVYGFYPGKSYSNNKTVYDIEVEGTHNYFANGVLVSNCVMQSRLMPGVYTRRQANGHLETQFNVKPGTGVGFRVGFEPDTAQYRLKISQANLHMYSLMHDLGVPDEELVKKWGPEIFKSNMERYDSRVLDKAYDRLVPKKLRKVEVDREEKIKRIKEAFEKANIAQYVANRNLPGMLGEKRASEERAKWAGREAMQKLAAERIESMPFEPDLTPTELREELYGWDKQAAVLNHPKHIQSTPFKWPAPDVRRPLGRIGYAPPAVNTATTATPTAPPINTPLCPQYEIDTRNSLLASASPVKSGSDISDAYIIKGNPEVMGTDIDKYDTFYNSVADILKQKGMSVGFDDGKPHTLPPGGKYWIGHSRGADRLRFAPEGVKTLNLDDFEPEETRKANEEAKEKIMEELGVSSFAEVPAEKRRAPGPEHYTLNEKAIEALHNMVGEHSPPKLQDLLKAKDHSDKKQYGAKNRIMALMMYKTPDEFLVDSDDGKFLGITHAPTGFRMHLPKNIVPAVVRSNTMDSKAASIYEEFAPDFGNFD